VTIKVTDSGYFSNVGIYRINDGKPPILISAICFKESQSCFNYTYDFKHYPNNPKYKCIGWYEFANSKRSELTITSRSKDDIDLSKDD